MGRLKRTTPLKRTPLKRGDSRLKRTPLGRTTPLKPVSERRSEKRVPGVYGPHHKWTKRQPCLIRDHPDHRDDCLGGGDSHHVTSVGAGGVDRENVVPLCRVSHQEGHTIGWETWQDKYGRDLDLDALNNWTRYREEMG